MSVSYRYNSSNVTFLQTNQPSATDPNKPQQVNYSLSGYFINYFSINQTTGKVSIVKGMPRDKPDGQPVRLMGHQAFMLEDLISY